MATTLTFDQCLHAIRAAADALVERFTATGPEARVPTCPDWTARELIVHQGIVHRWAAGSLRGDTDAQPRAEEAVPTEVGVADLAAWSQDGTAAVLDALTTAAADVAAPVFLNDAPGPRAFWARRQAHETTIHAVDALAAALGRVPTAAETGVGTELAVDGIDELLRGFFTRRRSTPTSLSVHVAPTDSPRRWTYRADPSGARVDEDPAAEATLSGTAAQLYLGLWNRGDELVCTGDETVLERWREHQHVTWR